MKTRVILAIITSCAIVACTQNKNIYKINNLTEQISKHKTIAILPAIVENEINKFLFSEDKIAEIKQEGYKEIRDVQGYIYNRLQEYPGEYQVHFLSPQETNKLLKEASIDVDDLYGNSKQHLNEILGTDAVIEVKVIRRYLMPIGGATTLSVLQGDDKEVNDDAGNVVTTASIYDKNGTYLWNIYTEADHNTFVTHKEATRKTLKKIVKKLPYKNY